MKKMLSLFISHGVALAIGFAAGIYFLPILVAPDGPSDAQVAEQAANANYKAIIREDLAGHDFVHWGKGEFSISASLVTLMGEVAPGPDYKLYLVPEFVEDESGFEAIKAQSVQIGDVKTFDNVILDIPQTIDIEAYNTILIWCESFGEFITAAKYR